MSNESSIEWIIKQLIFKTEFENLPIQYVLMSDKDIDSIIEQAKAKHKEECIKYYVDGVDYGDMGQHIRESLIQIAEKIYNETFGE